MGQPLHRLRPRLGGQGVHDRPDTAFPRGDTSRLTIGGAGPLAINLRVPAWAVRGCTVAINGVAQHVGAAPGHYLTLHRTWARGDTIDIRMPFSLRIERAVDRPDTAITPAGTTPDGDPLFTTAGLSLRPWYIGDAQPQSAYFRRVEPEIVFGSIDSGVPNVKRDDGLPRYDVPVQGITSPGHDGRTFLDVVWDHAPFADHGTFVSTVAQTADDFVAKGLFTPTQKDAVVSAAARARNELS